MENYGSGSLTSQIQAAQAAGSQLAQQQDSKKGKSKKLIVLFIILLLAGVGIFLIIRGVSGGDADAEPTPTSTPLGFVKSSSPTPTAEPEEEVDKKEISVEIQNGTGVTGEAGLLQEKLKGLGYSEIKTGNASSTDNEEATVTFSSKLPKSVQDEVTKLLKDTYKEVETKTASSPTTDIVVITGLRSGQTTAPKASATPTASPKASATATPTASPSN